jgi:NAD(P)-dependent dehydrogenase (short-subunit alcohol dehydrogenase family)
VRLQGKNIVITGGSQGIGFAVAKKCINEGAQVVIAARNQTDLLRSVAELKGSPGATVLSYTLDISDVNKVKAFASWCVNEVGDISGLVNCAGVYGPIGRTTAVDLQEFKEAININFLGAVYMCSLFAPILKSPSHKKIVNYSGGGAASPFPNYSAYATSKIALVRYTENIALELAAENIDINCIAPGFVITRLHQKTLAAGSEAAGASFYEGTKKQMETGGISSEKAANLTAFLLSDESDGITGKFISAPWDPWDSLQFQGRLRSDNDFCTIRRIDGKSFFKKT